MVISRFLKLLSSSRTTEKLISETVLVLQKNRHSQNFIHSIYHNFLDKPWMLSLHLGRQCDRNCPHCYARARDSRGPTGKDLEYEDFIHLIDQAAELSIEQIDLLGGEPLQFPDHLDIIRRINRYGIKCRVITGCSPVNRAKIIAVNRAGASLTCSIPWPSTGPDDDEIINKCRQACIEGIDTRLSWTATASNFRHINSLIRFAHRLNVPLLVERYHPVGIPEVDANNRLSPESWHYVSSRVSDSRIGPPSLPRKIFTMLSGSECSCFVCDMTVTSDGELLPCLPLPRSASIGNVKDHSLKKLWKIYRKKRSLWNQIPAECSSCSDKSTCRGGCKAFVYLCTGGFCERDSLCYGKGSPKHPA